MGQLSKQQLSQIEDYHAGLLSGDDRTRFEKWVSANPEARDYLLFLEQLDSMDASPTVQPPADLTDRIMQAVAKHRQAGVSLWGGWKNAGWAAAFLLVLGVGLYLVLGSRSGKNPAGPMEYAFVLNAPGARQVEVAGDFSGWKKVPLAKEQGRWKVLVPVSKGKDCQYVFILNKRLMVIDPASDKLLRDSKGNFYSILRLEDNGQGQEKMARSNFLHSTAVAFSIAMGALLSPAPVMAETLSPLMSQVQQDAQKAGWTAAETLELMKKVDGFKAQGLSDQSLEAVVRQTLPLGKLDVMDRSFDRLHLLVHEGLASDDAAKVVVKESQTEEKASDDEMQNSLASGLKEGAATEEHLPTQEQVEETLEQKREEWEARMEKQDQILSVPSINQQNHRGATGSGL